MHNFKLVVLCFAVLFYAAGCTSDKNKPANTNAEEKQEESVKVKLPDGTEVPLAKEDTLKKWGVSKKDIDELPEERVKIVRSYYLDTTLKGITAQPNKRLLAVDALFATKPQPADPDDSEIKDMEGDRHIGKLVARYHLNPQDGKPITELRGDKVPEFFRELLVFEVDTDFTKGLLYVEMKPRGVVKPKTVNNKPNLNEVKPILPQPLVAPKRQTKETK